MALATRMLPVADGSDFDGQPAQPGGLEQRLRLSAEPGPRAGWRRRRTCWVTHFGTEGPMARTVKDLALLLDVQAGYDARAPLSLASRAVVRGAARATRRATRAAPTRIGWLGDLGGHLAMEARHPRRLRRRPGAASQSIGCAVEPTALGFAPERIWDAWLVWRWWIVNARIAPLPDRSPRTAPRSSPRRSGSTTTARASPAPQVMAASIERSAFYQHVLTLFERFDVLALPTAQVWPFPVEERWPKEIAGRTMDTYHRWMEVVVIATFAGLPCISVPVGFNAAGLPMGMQLIGRPRGDLAVLRLAAAYETAAADVLGARPDAETTAGGAINPS